jgi:stress response protein SCP2
MERDTEGATDATLVQRIAQPLLEGEKTSERPCGLKAGDFTREERHDASSSLREVLLCVEWGFPAANQEDGTPRLHLHDQGSGSSQPDYLDGSCLVYAEERLLDVVDFRGAHSANMHGCQGQKVSTATFEWSAGRGSAAAVLHSGDVMTADGGTHVIRVQVDGLPACATDVFFMVSAYNCRNLSLFQKLAVRLLDGSCSVDEGTRLPSLSELRTIDAGTASSVVMCALTRRLDTWFLRDFARPCQATVRDYAPVESVLALAQERHCRWRRRRPYVLLSTMWQHGRATLKGYLGYCDHDEEEDFVVVRLMKLPTILFQCIVQLL